MTRRNRDREENAAAILRGDWSARIGAAVEEADLPPHLVVEGRKAAEEAANNTLDLYRLAFAYAGREAHILADEAEAAAGRWGRFKPTKVSRRERDKYETVRGKLADLALGRTEAADHAAKALEHVDKALASMSIAGMFDLPDERRIEYAVRDVTLCWCRRTGQPASVTYDQTSRGLEVKSGDLHRTPLVRFVECALKPYFPWLQPADIYRGIKIAADPNKRAGK